MNDYRTFYIFKINKLFTTIYNNFLITNIDKVILIGKEEYKDKKTTFPSNLPHNELIFHFSGKATVYFNDKIFETGENIIRFLPKGENKKYLVEYTTQNSNKRLLFFCRCSRM